MVLRGAHDLHDIETSPTEVATKHVELCHFRQRYVDVMRHRRARCNGSHYTTHEGHFEYSRGFDFHLLTPGFCPYFVDCLVDEPGFIMFIGS